MKELYLIRHGKTYGNTLGRYIGTTDEPLCEEGRRSPAGYFRSGALPHAGRPVRKSPEALPGDGGDFVSGQRVTSGSRLRECDFGEFENKV